MHSFEIKQRFVEFFKSKDHKVLPNVSLVPENDPTSLFNIAGVQPIVPNIMQGKHPLGKRLCGIQRCLRTNDIEEVGDSKHHTFFEMLGNWSLGDYFKKEAIEWSLELLVEQFGLDPMRIFVSAFEGKDSIPKDHEAVEIWKKSFKKYDINAQVFDKSKPNDENARIFLLDEKEVFWGPAGKTGPCGPSSEMHYYTGKGKPNFTKSYPGHNDEVDYIEIWNDVFMQYEKTKDGKFKPLKNKNVDTGAGFERLCMIIQNREKDGSLNSSISSFDTDLFDTPSAFLRSLIEDESRESTLDENKDKYTLTEFDPTLTDLKDIDGAVKSFRIIIDHMRACTFLIADGIKPSNKDRGYILRRLLRRTVRHGKRLGIEINFTKDMALEYIEKYKVQYPHLEKNSNEIVGVLEKEEIEFEKTIQRGQKELESLKGTGKEITGKDLFNLYETYGFPIEMALDNLQLTTDDLQQKYIQEYKEAEKQHQAQSRKGAEGKFKGGLADHSKITTRYHTATHLLLKALQKVLGDHVHQKGSNITKERLRFDFSHDSKLTNPELKEVEELVNKKIGEELEVEKKEMSFDKAVASGAEHEFDQKYPNKVTVYTIKNPKTGKVFSKELCMGPHVENTKELAESGNFKIIKEESCGAGVRRIRAVLNQN